MTHLRVMQNCKNAEELKQLHPWRFSKPKYCPEILVKLALQ